MCIPTASPFVRQQVVATSTSGVVMVTTPWMLAFGASGLRTVSELRSNSGNLTSKAKYRFASVLQTKPADWDADAGTQLTGEGYQVDSFDLSGDTNQLWVQGGLEVASSSGVADALAMLRATADITGQIVARRTIEVTTTNNANPAYVPLGPPQPMVGLGGVMFAVVFTQGDGTTYFQPCYREIKDDIEAGETWATLGSQQTGSADTTYNSGTLTITESGTDVMYWQPGLMFKTSNGSSVIKVTVAAKW